MNIKKKNPKFFLIDVCHEELEGFWCPVGAGKCQLWSCDWRDVLVTCK